jgi:hypothetical protein
MFDQPPTNSVQIVKSDGKWAVVVSSNGRQETIPCRDEAQAKQVAQERKKRLGGFRR